MAVLGVDGWRGAWVGALLDGRGVTLLALPDVAAVLAVPDVELVGIDMPIGLSDDGVRRNSSTSSVASSSLCCRAPIETTLASLCCRASCAVEVFQTSAARTPGTLFAAICSPFPDPPMTTPSEPGSVTVRSPTSKQNGG